MEGKVPITFAIFFLGLFRVAFAQYYDDELLGLEMPEAVKRMYDMGAAKKPHPYVSQYKRLPLYNFGLGKRSSPYNFGLGKRSIEDEDIADEYDDYPVFDEEEFSDPTAYISDEMATPEKRQNKYSFGLGKRRPKYDFGLGKRLPKYDFGLGKRLPKYDFGLGKRSGQYSFGLGKKSTPVGSLNNRYSFGLGKRSDETQAYAESTEKNLEKREVPSNDPEELIGRAADGRIRSTLDKESDFVQSFGRSTSNAPSPSLLNGYFRKPHSLNVSLGKRRPRYDFGLGKRNYQMEK